MQTDLEDQPTALVANLPYNVAVPALLHLLAEFPTIRTVMVMVQAEVAERLAAEPGGKDYGVPSAKVRFYGNVRRYGMVSPTVFWPIPRVYSGLVRIDRLRDLAVAHRRRTSATRCSSSSTSRSRSGARPRATRSPSGPGSGNESAERLLSASIDPARRGETLGIADFVRLLQRSGQWNPRRAAASATGQTSSAPTEPTLLARLRSGVLGQELVLQWRLGVDRVVAGDPTRSWATASTRPRTAYQPPTSAGTITSAIAFQ